jgi:hypothetical protein
MGLKFIMELAGAAGGGLGRVNLVESHPHGQVLMKKITTTENPII